MYKKAALLQDNLYPSIYTLLIFDSDSEHFVLRQQEKRPEDSCLEAAFASVVEHMGHISEECEVKVLHMVVWY